MKITDETLEYISNLSRLSITRQTKDDLFKIAGYMDILNDIDTNDIDSTSANVLRDDKVQKSVCSEVITSNAKSTKDGYFKVPKTVE